MLHYDNCVKLQCIFSHRWWIAIPTLIATVLNTATSATLHTRESAVTSITPQTASTSQYHCVTAPGSVLTLASLVSCLMATVIIQTGTMKRVKTVFSFFFSLPSIHQRMLFIHTCTVITFCTIKIYVIDITIPPSLPPSLILTANYIHNCYNVTVLFKR